MGALISRVLRHALSGSAGAIVVYAPSISAKAGAIAAGLVSVLLSHLSDKLSKKF